MTNDSNFMSHGMGWLPEPPDHRDLKIEIRSDLLGEAPAAKTDLRVLCPAIRNQGQIGSCTAFGSLAAFQIVTKKIGLVVRMGSELFEYYETRRYINTLNTDSGGYIRDAWKVLANLGMAPEPDWPYDISKFTQPPPGPAYQHALSYQALKYYSVPNDVVTMKQILTNGFPITIGFSVPANFPMGQFTGNIPMPSGNIIGGHCVCVVGHDDDRQAWCIRNSWGTNWGSDVGYAWMPYAFLQQLGSDFWTPEVVEGDEPTPPTPPPPTPETDLQALRRILGVVDGVTIHFTKSQPWPLAIQAPPSDSPELFVRRSTDQDAQVG